MQQSVPWGFPKAQLCFFLPARTGFPIHTPSSDSSMKKLYSQHFAPHASVMKGTDLPKMLLIPQAPISSTWGMQSEPMEEMVQQKHWDLLKMGVEGECCPHLKHSPVRAGKRTLMSSKHSHALLEGQCLVIYLIAKDRTSSVLINTPHGFQRAWPMQLYILFAKLKRRNLHMEKQKPWMRSSRRVCPWTSPLVQTSSFVSVGPCHGTKLGSSFQPQFFLFPDI